jgi:hypothetical protein
MSSELVRSLWCHSKVNWSDQHMRQLMRSDGCIFTLSPAFTSIVLATAYCPLTLHAMEEDVTSVMGELLGGERMYPDALFPRPRSTSFNHAAMTVAWAVTHLAAAAAARKIESFMVTIYGAEGVTRNEENEVIVASVGLECIEGRDCLRGQLRLLEERHTFILSRSPGDQFMDAGHAHDGGEVYARAQHVQAESMLQIAGRVDAGRWTQRTADNDENFAPGSGCNDNI